MTTPTTTIQVSRDIAETIKRTYPSLSYDDVLRRLLAGTLSHLGTDTSILDFRKTINPATQNEEIRRECMEAEWH